MKKFLLLTFGLLAFHFVQLQAQIQEPYVETVPPSTEELTPAPDLPSSEACNNWSIGFDFDALIPTDVLKDNGFGIGYGGNIDAFYVGLGNTGQSVVFTPGFRFKGGATPVEFDRDVILSIPQDEPGQAEVYNSFVDFKLVPRIILNNNHKLKTYIEGHAGIRYTGAYEKISLVDRDSRFRNDTNKIESEISGVAGFSGGVLIQVADRVDINMRYTKEYSNVMRHLDMNTNNFSNTVASKRTKNHSVAIGVLIRLSCDDEKSSDCDCDCKCSRRSNCHRSNYNNYDNFYAPQRIKVRK